MREKEGLDLCIFEILHFACFFCFFCFVLFVCHIAIAFN